MTTDRQIQTSAGNLNLLTAATERTEALTFLDALAKTLEESGTIQTSAVENAIAVAEALLLRLAS